MAVRGVSLQVVFQLLPGVGLAQVFTAPGSSCRICDGDSAALRVAASLQSQAPC